MATVDPSSALPNPPKLSATVSHLEHPAPPTTNASVDAKSIAASWLTDFSQAIASSKPEEAVTALFLPNGYWRDLLSLSWDFRTLHGHDKIKAFLAQDSDLFKKRGLNAIRVSGEPALVQGSPEHEWVQTFFDFETSVARGRGLVRLMRDPQDRTEQTWKAFTFYTGIEEMKGHEEKSGPTRPRGVNHGEHEGRVSWKARRAAKKDFVDSEPEVVIVGAGQAGLTVAARLGQLGVDTLIVERNARIGDNWRKRYDFLVLHDPVWYDHLPYINFPQNWPIFTPKDKLADWFEAYAASMELNIWLSTELQSAVYDDASRKWTIKATRPDGTERCLRPAHLVMATGHSGEPNIPHFKGLDKFKGQVCHSSQHGTGANWRGKNAVVVGCCNSGHDIAHDFYESGAKSVTMVQRSSTYVMSSDSVLDILMKGLYDQDGPSVEDADVLFNSVPNPLYLTLHKHVTQRIAEYDRETLDGLRKAGFKLDFGPNDSGFLMKYFTRGGGYYLDVGASKLIADGKIKIKQGKEIDYFDDDGVVFEDGSKLPADVVVLATGYQNMRTTARRILGDKVADRANDVWGLNEEGEIRTMWRFSGHPGFWFMGGNLALCRFYSKRLALQIKAIQLGLHRQ